MTEVSAQSGATTKNDILVAGVGSTGLAAALAFARAGMKTALVGRIPPPLPGRTVALFEASIRFLDALGALERVKGSTTRTSSSRCRSWRCAQARSIFRRSA